MNPQSPGISLGIQAPRRFRHHAFDPAILHRIKQLRPDNWHGLAYLLKDYAVIAFFLWLTLGVSWWFYPLSLLMIGAHQRGISTILHDSAHGVLARNRTLNFLLGTFPTAWLIFQRHFAYRRSHVQTHHPYLGRADADPDLAFFIGEGVFTPRSDRAFLWRIVILPLLGSKTLAYLKYLVRNRYNLIKRLLGGGGGGSEGSGERSEWQGDWRQRFDRWGFAIFWAGLLAFSAVQGFWSELLLLWVVPYLTSFHIIGWFIEMSEHCSSTEGQSVNLHMARNRRSRHLEKWLTAINNDHHHLDHHLDPTTPFWRLPEAYAIRMRDPAYAAHCAQTGGIFQRGSEGEPSIVDLIRQQNRKRRLAAARSEAGGPLSLLRQEPA